MAADVAGYSRLIGADEEGTLAQLKAFRKTLVDPTIAKHRGRIVKTTGDGMLVEFASAVDAARCAVEVQRGMADENTEIPRPSGSSSASASIWETSSSTTTISSAMASILQRGSKASLCREAFRSLVLFTIRSVTGSMCVSTTRARSR